MFEYSACGHTGYPNCNEDNGQASGNRLQDSDHFEKLPGISNENFHRELWGITADTCEGLLKAVQFGPSLSKFWRRGLETPDFP